MVNETEMSVFKELRPYLRLLEAFNGENFRHQNNWCLAKNILFAAFSVVIFASAAAFPAFSLWHCIENGAHFDKLSTVIPVALSIVQLVLTHVSLMLKNRLIRATIDGFQKAVTDRKFLF